MAEGSGKWQKVAEDGRRQWKAVEAEESRLRLRKKVELARRSSKGEGVRGK